MIDLDSIRIEGAGGGGDSSPPPAYVPVESPNTLQSKSVYRAIELISEGEIEGLVNGQKSIFANGVALQNDDDSYNFQGVTVHERTGALGQSAIPGFPAVETPVAVGVEMTVAAGTVTQVVTDPNTDAVYILVTIPALYEQKDNGDLDGTSVSFTIQINSEAPVTKTVTGKCMSSYQANYRVDLPAGGAPWSVKLTRTTADSGSATLKNATHWTSLTELIDHKLEYRDSAVIGLELDAELFGNQVPERSYLVRGLKVVVPTGYTPPLKDAGGVWQPAVYPGTWDGTFQSARYTSNPAWILYDLITNERYGCRLPDPGSALKYALYPIAQRCDELISDGLGGAGVEPRYHLNCVLNNPQEAYALISQIVATFQGMSWWGPGSILVSQDAPATPQVLATPANVLGGEFVYEGTGLKTRYTVCMVTWNDPANHFKPTPEVVENRAALLKYGYRPVEIAPLGCTSRGLAIRLGRWAVDTPHSATQTVSYIAGLDHAFVTPGQIIAVADPFYANTNLGGLIVAVLGTAISLDRPVTLTVGETYDLYCTLPDGTLESRAITTASDDLGHETVTVLTAFSTDPQVDSVWTVTGTDVAHRLFTCLSNTEIEVDKGTGYQIKGLLYDPAKFARVEEDIIVETPAYSTGFDTGVILPPNNASLLLKTYYADGQLQNMLVFSWEASTDNRVTGYRVQFKAGPNANWLDLGVSGFSAELMEVQTNHYYFRVQAVSRTGATSTWLLDDLDVTEATMPDVTGLVLVDGDSATTYTGGNAGFSWDAVASSSVAGKGGVDAWFQSYVVEIVKSSAVVRTEYPETNEYVYSYEKNVADGGATRSFDINVYQRGNLGQVSSTAATLSVTNTAPTMAGFTPTATATFKGIKLDWSAMPATDTDLDKFIVLLDTSNPPTTEAAWVGANTLGHTESGLTVGTQYYAKVVPYDKFGAGVASEVANATPVILADTDVDLELTSSVTMTDSDDNTAATLLKLYDRNTASDGVAYTLAGTDKYIEYAFPIAEYIDRVIWHTADANGNVYFAYSNDAGATWSWLGAEADHTLDADGYLVAAASQAAAQTDYLDQAAGLNMAKFPARAVANRCRLYFTGSYSTTLYELVFSRQIVAEQAAIDNLAALSAQLGTILSGLMQSPNWVSSGGTDGMQIDLDNETIDFGDGMQMSAADKQIIFGDNQIIFDGVTGAITIAPAGGISGNDYVLLSGTEIKFYYYFAGAHREYKSLRRRVEGTATHGDTVQVDYFKSKPSIALSPANIQTYEGSSAADQSQLLGYTDPTETSAGSGTWEFDVSALLILTGDETVHDTDGTLSIAAFGGTGGTVATPDTGKSFTPGAGTDLLEVAFSLTVTVNYPVAYPAAQYDAQLIFDGTTAYNIAGLYDDGNDGSIITRTVSGTASIPISTTNELTVTLNAQATYCNISVSATVGDTTAIISSGSVAADGELRWVAIGD